MPLADALAALGIPAEDPQAAAVSRMLDAISLRIRSRTRRAFEGSPTVYDQVYRVRNQRGLVLPHVPVDAVFSVRQVAFDGTESGVQTPVVVAGGATTSLGLAAVAGATNLKLVSMATLAVGKLVRVGSGSTQEVVRVTSIGTAGAGGTGAGIEPPLRHAQALTAAVAEVKPNVGDAWRLDDPARGVIRIDERADYARVVYRVTGEIPDDVEQAALEWLESRWGKVDTQQLASQSSDGFSESYIVPLRSAPEDAAAVMAHYFHPAGAVVG